MSIWSDTLALAKAGYKAGEIKELLKEKENEEKEALENGNKETETETETETKTDSHDEREKDKHEEVIDWESKFKKVETKLKKLQEENNKVDISKNDDNKTVEEKANEILAGIIGGK